MSIKEVVCHKKQFDRAEVLKLLEDGCKEAILDYDLSGANRSGAKEPGKPSGLPFSLFFGRLAEKKFCLLQVLRYRRVVNQTSSNCYKSLKSKNIFMSTFSRPPQAREKV